MSFQVGEVASVPVVPAVPHHQASPPAASSNLNSFHFAKRTVGLERLGGSSQPHGRVPAGSGDENIFGRGRPPIPTTRLWVREGRGTAASGFAGRAATQGNGSSEGVPALPKITQATQGRRLPQPREEAQVWMGAQIPGWPGEGGLRAPELSWGAGGGNSTGSAGTSWHGVQVGARGPGRGGQGGSLPGGRGTPPSVEDRAHRRENEVAKGRADRPRARRARG